MVHQSGTVLLVSSHVPLHTNLGEWVPHSLSVSAWQLPHLLLPLLLWLKLSLAYLTQAYVDFIPRHSEAVPSFEAGALWI